MKFDTFQSWLQLGRNNGHFMYILDYLLTNVIMHTLSTKMDTVLVVVVGTMVTDGVSDFYVYF